MLVREGKQTENGVDSPIAMTAWESIKETWLTPIRRSLWWWIKWWVLVDQWRHVRVHHMKSSPAWREELKFCLEGDSRRK